MNEATIALATIEDVLRHPAMSTVGTAEESVGLDLETREQLEQVILAGSLDLEKACGRWFRQRDDWEEILDVSETARVFTLSAYPVTELVSVTYAEDGVFTDVDPMPASAYALLRGGKLGEFTFRSTAPCLAASPASLKVTYKGGLAALVHQVPSLLRQGLVAQIAYGWKQAPNLEVSGISQDKGSVTYFRKGVGTPAFQRAVGRYRERLL